MLVYGVRVVEMTFFDKIKISRDKSYDILVHKKYIQKCQFLTEATHSINNIVEHC